jgi:hypothetical protein
VSYLQIVLFFPSVIIVMMTGPTFLLSFLESHGFIQGHLTQISGTFLYFKTDEREESAAVRNQTLPNVTPQTFKK